MFSKCRHSVRLSARGETYLDSNVVMMAMRMTCEHCGTAFRAIGVGEVVGPERPSFVEETMVFPLVPVGEEPWTEATGRC